jgi:hypothetical protein
LIFINFRALLDREGAWGIFYIVSSEEPRKGKKVKPPKFKKCKSKQSGLLGLCYAMDGGYKGWNPYRERHLAIFVNYF